MNKKGFQKEKKHKINGEVRFPEVRLSGEIRQGEIMSSYDAFKLAESMGKDLILIAENAKPPVVRIEDYGKFLYEIEKRDKETRKNQKKTEVKEIQLSLNIAEHDLLVKSKKALEFLNNGNKVKCSLSLKGRERSMSDKGQIVMLKFANLLEDSGVPETMPKLEGNKWNMIVKSLNK